MKAGRPANGHRVAKDGENGSSISFRRARTVASPRGGHDPQLAIKGQARSSSRASGRREDRDRVAVISSTAS